MPMVITDECFIILFFLLFLRYIVKKCQFRLNFSSKMARNARKNKIKHEKKLAREKIEREKKLKFDTKQYEEIEYEHSNNEKQTQIEPEKQSSKTDSIDENSSNENEIKRKHDCKTDKSMEMDGIRASINRGKEKRTNNLKGPATSNTESHKNKEFEVPSGKSYKHNSENNYKKKNKKAGDEYNSKTNKDHSTQKCTQREKVVCRESSQSRKSDRHNSSSNRNNDLDSDDQLYFQADKNSWRANNYDENSNESSKRQCRKDESMEIDDLPHKTNERYNKQANNHEVPAVNMEWQLEKHNKKRKSERSYRHDSSFHQKNHFENDAPSSFNELKKRERGKQIDNFKYLGHRVNTSSNESRHYKARDEYNSKTNENHTSQKYSQRFEEGFRESSKTLKCDRNYSSSHRDYNSEQRYGDHSSRRNDESQQSDRYPSSFRRQTELNNRRNYPRHYNDDPNRNNSNHFDSGSYDKNINRYTSEGHFGNGSTSMPHIFENKNKPKKKKNKQPLYVPNADYYKPTIREVEGDLFETNEEYSLAHCVAEDFRMGAGIAIRFKEKFSGVEKLLSQGKRIGEVAILQRKNRFIFYLVTKARSDGKPTYESITKAIQSLKEYCLKFNVKKLAIPRIGCGLDRLDWGNVKDILFSEFRTTDIELVVYVL